uniref:Helitron helicase-like domain-containing protein n=1 Tax=Oryza sativa subsp. japonica TaxID=39947 RepID=Q6F2R5_ORYSJ|nr:hypothetical protein [Oryza sativa Japonica Group]
MLLGDGRSTRHPALASATHTAPTTVASPSPAPFRFHIREKRNDRRPLKPDFISVIKTLILFAHNAMAISLRPFAYIANEILQSTSTNCFVSSESPLHRHLFISTYRIRWFMLSGRMDNTIGSSQPIIRRRGRPRRQPSNIPIPHPNQTVAAESRRRRRQVIDANRNRASTSADQRILCPRLIGESSNSNHIAQNEPPIHIGSSTSNQSFNHRRGRIWLPPYQPPPQPLLDLLTSQNSTLSNHFFDHIRQYNSMFVITSMGAKINESINDGRAPYVFKISGQVCHRIGSLLPPQGHRPEYAQLYIFDTEHEISNRINVASSSRVTFHANEQIVASLIEMLNTNNPIVQLFRTAHERISLDASDQFCIRLFGKLDANGDIYSAPVASEVVGLIVGDVGSADVGRDIIIQDRASRLQRINENHCKFMAMQYPLLFPYGEDGYHENLTYRTTACTQSMQQNKVTMLECYAYRLHDRPGDFNTPLRCKRVTQSYEVDSYCCVEGSRIAHYCTPAFQIIYTIEFQKRGLPHVHIIIWLAKTEPLDSKKIDHYISAQLPDPAIDQIGFEAVSSFIVHGPCGPHNTSSICMSD